MKRNTVLFALTISLSLLITGCSGCGKGKNDGGNGTNTTSSQSGPDMNLIKIKKGDKVLLDSPEKFVQVYILFNYKYKNWVNEVNLNTNMAAGAGEVFLSKKREEFYKGLNLTEENFTQYSNNHFKEIEAFLEQNPEYKKALDESLK